LACRRKPESARQRLAPGRVGTKTQFPGCRNPCDAVDVLAIKCKPPGPATRRGNYEDFPSSASPGKHTDECEPLPIRVICGEHIFTRTCELPALAGFEKQQVYADNPAISRITGVLHYFKSGFAISAFFLRRRVRYLRSPHAKVASPGPLTKPICQRYRRSGTIGMHVFAAPLHAIRKSASSSSANRGEHQERLAQ